MKVWISRDYDDEDYDACVNITEYKPAPSKVDDKIWVFPAKGLCGFMPVKNFEENFNIKIPKGFCKQFELIINEISF